MFLNKNKANAKQEGEFPVHVSMCEPVCIQEHKTELPEALVTATYKC